MRLAHINSFGELIPERSIDHSPISAPAQYMNKAKRLAQANVATATSSTSMPIPSLASKSSLTSASTPSTTTSYTFQASVPNDELKNPFIIKQTMPTNLVFIILIAIFGLVAVSVLSTWLFVWWKSRRRAKTEKEVQYYNPFQYESGHNGSASHLLNGSSQSSFTEKSSGSVNSKMSDSASLSFDATTPGRTYREMQNSRSRRGSMTISPILDMMRSSASNLDLPLFNPLSDLPQSYVKVQEGSSELPGKKSRPPSQVLDDMLNAIEFSTNYPEAHH